MLTITTAAGPGRAAIGRGAAGDLLFARELETPLGPMVAVAHDAGLALLEFGDRRGWDGQVAALNRHVPGAVVAGDHPHLDRLAGELERYFAGTLTAFAVPLVVAGSPFQEAVWAALRAIPYGATTSYGLLAGAIGRTGAAQAVGRANGQNRLAIVVPCHRVIRGDGHPCGYAGGLDRKRWLLDHERRVVGGDAARPFL